MADDVWEQPSCILVLLGAGMLPEKTPGMQSTKVKRLRRQRCAGFSMIEIMLVLALIGLIMGVVVAGLRKRARDGQIQIARMQVRQLAGSLYQQRLANGGECPSLASADAAPTSETKDPWGRSLVIVCPGEHEQDGADVVSLGPDGRPGSDDIESWKLQ